MTIGDGQGGAPADGDHIRSDDRQVNDVNDVNDNGDGGIRPRAVGDPGGNRPAPILLKVEYKRLNTFFYDYTKNISKGGTFIKTERPLGVGTVFLFRLTVPVTPEPIELRGEVHWVIRRGESPPPEMPDGKEPGMGIRFTYVDAEERRRLEGTVEKMMVTSLGQLAYARLLGGC